MASLIQQAREKAKQYLTPQTGGLAQSKLGQGVRSFLQTPVNLNQRGVVNKVLTSKPVTTAENWLQNMVYKPITQVPQNIQTIRQEAPKLVSKNPLTGMPEVNVLNILKTPEKRQAAIKTGGSAISTLGALFPAGPEDIGISAFQAWKAKRAGTSPIKAFTGEETVGLGEAFPQAPQGIKSFLSAAELPLLIFGGLKAQGSAAKRASILKDADALEAAGRWGQKLPSIQSDMNTWTNVTSGIEKLAETHVPKILNSREMKQLKRSDINTYYRYLSQALTEAVDLARSPLRIGNEARPKGGAFALEEAAKKAEGLTPEVKPMVKAEEINKKLQELSDSPEFQSFYKGGKVSGKSWNEYQRLSREYRDLVGGAPAKILTPEVTTPTKALAESTGLKPQTIVQKNQKVIESQADNIPSGAGSQIDPVQKITQLLKEAKPMRNQQEALYSAERSRRVAKLAAIGKSAKGEKGFYAQLGALKGELPKVEFSRIRQGLTQPDIDSLYSKIEDFNMSPFEKINAKTGLSKLLGAEGGQIPTKSELKLLNETFGKDFVNAIQEKRPFIQKLFSGILNALNVPRAIMATGDLSAPLRQGIFLVSRPKQWGPAFKEMFKYAGSEKAYEGLIENIKSRPNYQLMRENKLALTDIGDNLLSREEEFMSTLPEKIPLFGSIAKGSNRAYSGFLNKLRADTFDDLVQRAKEQGVDNSQTLSNIANFVNTATGRGDLGKFKNAAEILNATFFSPRLMASRLQLLNPVYYTKLDPFTRKEALKSLLGFAGTAGTVLGLSKLAGAEVGTDPRSANFGKIKIGNTRYDILGGFQQYIKLASQLISGQVLSSESGKLITLGEGYKPLTRKDIIMRFFESKTSPVASFITNLLTGQTGTGEPVNLTNEIVTRFIPMMVQDMQSLYQEWGPKGLLMGVPGIFGAGSQTYGRKELVTGTNLAGEPTSQVRPVQGLSEKITERIQGPKPLGTSSSWNLESYYEQLKTLPKEQAKQEFDTLIKTNPEAAKKMLDIIKKRQQGITIQDEVLKQKGVASGDRAKEIAKQFNKLKTKEEKAKLWEDYVRKGIINADVSKQLKNLLNK